MSDLVTIRMATSLAGVDFSHAPGDLVAVAPDIAEAWVLAGIATLPEERDALEGRTADLEKRVAALVEERDALAVDKADLLEQIEEAAAAATEGHTRIASVEARSAALDAALKLEASKVAALISERDQAQAELRGANAKVASLTRSLDLVRAEKAREAASQAEPDGVSADGDTDRGAA